MSNPQKPVNFPDMINKIQAKLDSIGPPPYSDQQKEEVKNLQLILAKAKQENLKTESEWLLDMKSELSSLTPLAGGAQAHYQVQNTLSEQKPVVGAAAASQPSTHKILDRKRLQDLAKEIDPMTQLDDDVEEVLMQVADDFIENVISSSCDIAKHRNSDTLEVKDVQLHLERAWNMWIPGFGSEELRPYKKAMPTEAHKQKMALIKKTLKKS